MEDIELVRRHRNSDPIRNTMEYREEITPAMQEKWFHSINNLQNNYFVIVHKGEKIGLISGAGIDWQKKETANGGIFIWDPSSLKTSIPLRASLLLTDLSFILGLERTYIKVLKDNDTAISYNTGMGYELLPGQENITNQTYVLTAASYREKTQKLRKVLHGENEKIDVCITDQGNDFSDFYIKLFRSAGTDKLTLTILPE